MTDEPLARGAPEGSLRYFAVLYALPDSRRTVEALYAFQVELRDTIRAREHDVAHARLQFWRGEIDRLVAGAPAHPIAQALLPLRAAGQDVSQLHEVLTAADYELARLPLDDAQALAALAWRAEGVLQTLAAAACKGGAPLSESERRFARALGQGVFYTERLRTIADRADLAARAEETLRTLPALLAPDERPGQRHGLVLGALYARLQRKLVQLPVAARQDLELSPWAKLWTSWRTALRYS